MKILVINLVFVLVAVISLSPCYGAGTTGADFLKIGIGARASGMGEAFVGLADDINAINYNPAGAAKLNREIMVMHNEWIQGINMEYIACVYRAGNLGTFGLSGTMLLVGDMDRYDNLGNDLDEKYDAMDSAVTFTYGREIADKISAGVNVKYIQQRIEREKATGFAVDIGLLFKGIAIADKVLSMGLVVQNIGEDIKFMSASDKLPQVMRLGLSYPMVEQTRNKLTGNVDISQLIEGDIYMNYGAEYGYRITRDMTLIGRAGYKTGMKGLDGIAGLTGGIGININSYNIDYCFMPLGSLNETHRISLSIKY